MKKDATYVDYYAIMGVSRTATAQEIELTYKKLARIWHPDRFPDKEKKAKAEAMMKTVNTAYDILHTPQKRRIYDSGADRQEMDDGGFSFDPFQGFGQAEEFVMEGDIPNPFDFLFGGGQGGGGGQRIEFQDGGEFRFEFGF
jgi:DnaJ-class molecular chaperone